MITLLSHLTETMSQRVLILLQPCSYSLSFLLPDSTCRRKRGKLNWTNTNQLTKSFIFLFRKLAKFWNLVCRDSLGLGNIGKQKWLLQAHKTLVPNFLLWGKKMLNRATFSSAKKNCHWSRTEHCPFWALSQDALVGREEAYIWKEEIFLWQVDLKEWQLSETAEGDSFVQCILGERG